MALLVGGCLCGAVSYKVDGEPDGRFQITCHCRDCQQLTGAGHARSMGVQAEDVTWQGTPRVFEIQHEKSTVETAFCDQCGSQLYKRTSGLPHLLFLHVGSLEPESSKNWRPNHFAFTERRAPWDTLEEIA